jgi:hypothetical protein
MRLYFRYLLPKSEPEKSPCGIQSVSIGEANRSVNLATIA